MKILVVDDIATNRKLVRVVLEAEAVLVIEAIDGQDALAKLEAEPVDVVISDIMMPRMDGYRLFQEIRQRAALRHIGIIAYTSTYLSKQDEQLALRSGADRYLRKPAPTETLLRLIHELVAPGALPRPTPPPQETAVMLEYNAALVRKLEEKRAELELRNAELTRANDELAASRARFESIITSAMDAIITVDEEQRIVLFNAAAEAMFGAPATEMLGASLDRLLPERFRSGHAEHVAKFGAAGMTSRRMGALGAISGRRANGEEFPIEASISKTQVGGRRFFTVILRDISERERAEAELRRATEQLRALAAHTETVRENERARVAREIHDVLAQELTRLKIDLIWVAKRTAKPIDEPTRVGLISRVDDAIAQANTAISTVQRIATELRPVILDSLGLPAAVEWQVEDFGRRTGLSCRVSAPHGESALDRESATAVFRILQESLTNVARHAQATAVEVNLIEDRAAATLSVADNGRGITAAQIADPHSIGLVGMRERAQAFGGTVAISGEPTRGTTVRVQIPLEGRR
jgi:PAS domain S-box-containing protein